ncbi:hypothetical protein BDSB_22890 [Burkholderia dolosa PC543]|nr:hypothetical protein BDSB_22890 [Burkholderia dolosa PC543]
MREPPETDAAIATLQADRRGDQLKQSVTKRKNR